MFPVRPMFAAMTIAVLGAALPTYAADQAPAPQTHQQRHEDRVEARIKELHDRLHVTDAQAERWNAVAQVMRENVKTQEALIKEKRRDEKNATAVDDLRAYQEIAEAHAEGVKKLTAAFGTFYDTLSPEQKKAADEYFHERKRHHASQKAR